MNLRGCWSIFDRSKYPLLFSGTELWRMWAAERLLDRSQRQGLRTSSRAGFNWQAYVTTVINSIMCSPCWGSTAVFLSWDDWGGFYDQVVPPVIDGEGYGFRVPGLVISPYARAGYIDHQQLSHDAYLKFIEDDFMGGQRLNPATDGRPDSRPDVREEAPGLGNLESDFDFCQAPRPPLILPVEPAPGPASSPPGSVGPGASEAPLTPCPAPPGSPPST